MSHSELVETFTAVDERIVAATEKGALRSLRRRLLGELLGDPETVGSSVAADFELLMHAGGQLVHMSAELLVASIQRQRAAGVINAIGLGDLVVDGRAIAGHGSLLTISPGGGQRSLTSTPIGFFMVFGDDGLMISEVAFLDSAASSTTPFSDASVTVESLRALVGEGP